MADMVSPYDQTVEWELRRVPADEREIPKLTKTEAGYTAVPGRHQCWECWKFIVEREDVPGTRGVGRCADVEGTIKGIGTCNHWRKGRYMAEEGGCENPDKLSKIAVAYMERPDGFQCASCLRYSPDGEEGRCRVVWGRIGAPHCCNNWTDGEPWVPLSQPTEAREAGPEAEPPAPGPVDEKAARLAELART